MVTPMFVVMLMGTTRQKNTNTSMTDMTDMTDVTDKTVMTGMTKVVMAARVTD